MKTHIFRYEGMEVSCNSLADYRYRKSLRGRFLGFIKRHLTTVHGR